MKKTFILAILMIALGLGSAGLAFAQTTTMAPKVTIDISCVATAVATREAAIQTAFNTYSEAISSALTTRASSLATAWTLTDRTARNKAIKAAWSAYTSSMKSARAAHNAAVKKAWSSFFAARKACKAPSTGENSSIDNVN